MSAVLHEPTVSALSISHLSKTFPGQMALRDASLEVAPGEVHALVGQNGSGKSTLIKVLCGYHEADPGATASVRGAPLELGDPRASHAAGLRFVHQDLALIPQLSAVENIAFGGGFATSWGRINWARQRDSARAALATFGFDFDVDAPVEQISPVERTAVAISRALADGDGVSGVLVLDEPTAFLPGPEVRRLHEIVSSLIREGKSVIYVSHRLDDVFAVADRVTVLREGRVVGTSHVADITIGDLTRMMVGHEVAASERTSVPVPQKRREVLTARGLGGRTFADVNLELAEGEVLGIAGVLGSGRDELAAALGGAATGGGITGELRLDGRVLDPSEPVHARAAGLAYVPPERKTQALLGAMGMRENLTLAALDRCRRGMRRLSRSAEDRFARDWADRVGVVPSGALERGIANFSGGNQQKVVIGRALTIEPRVLVLAEPTAGVDIGAREALYDVIRDEGARRNLATVVASTDTQDLIALCHRVLVMRGGRVVAELSGASITSLAVSHAIEEPGEPAVMNGSGNEQH